ncbi:MAG: class I SAM-dependent methyltransferase [Myxococcaceae bacterium]|jgi:ubiquinone/menaquinone biosynthesis C-methylase UbiE|nr:MAG: class I SAM-dependent methyltransferase [Myxococcaceae bacterium]
MTPAPHGPHEPSDEYFIPALRFRVLTRAYDALLSVTLDEARHKRALIEQAAIAPGHAVLDLGCGTGTLTRLIKGAHADASVTGLDLDPEALGIARHKAADAGLDITFVQGSATAPPFEPASFDRVLTSLVLHHLVREQKQRALAAAWSLLRRDGELHVADWGRPLDLLMKLASLPVRLLDGFAPTRDNVEGNLPALLREAGFVDVAETRSARTLYGTLTHLRARRPA